MRATEYPQYEEYRDDVSPWLGRVPTVWKFEKGKWHHLYRKILNSKGENENVLSLTLRGVVNNDPENPQGLVPNDYRTYQIFDKDDLVFKLIDLENVRTSRVGLVHECGIMSSAYIRVIPSNKTVPRFLYYFYYNLYLTEVYNRIGSGVRSTLNQYDLLDIPVPILPQNVQAAIVTFLDEKTLMLDRAIANKMNQIALLSERKRIIIQEAVTSGLNPNVPMKDSGVDWIGQIPAHWKITETRYSGTLQNGISEGAEYFGKGHPFVTYGDVFNHPILSQTPSGLAMSSSSDREKYSVRTGDVFFTRTSEVANEIGIAATCLETISDATFSGFLIRMRPNSELFTQQYSKFVFRADYVREFFSLKMNIVTRASLAQGLLKDLPLFVPPISEQEILVRHLESETQNIDEGTEIKNRQIIALKEYKVSLINAAVTGKIKVV